MFLVFSPASGCGTSRAPKLVRPGHPNPRTPPEGRGFAVVRPGEVPWVTLGPQQTTCLTRQDQGRNYCKCSQSKGIESDRASSNGKTPPFNGCQQKSSRRSYGRLVAWASDGQRWSKAYAETTFSPTKRWACGNYHIAGGSPRRATPHVERSIFAFPG